MRLLEAGSNISAAGGKVVPWVLVRTNWYEWIEIHATQYWRETYISSSAEA